MVVTIMSQVLKCIVYFHGMENTIFCFTFSMQGTGLSSHKLITLIFCSEIILLDLHLSLPI